MGRLRNLSQSLKGLTSNNQNDHSSPTIHNRPTDASEDMRLTKEVPVIARESSSNSIPASMSATSAGRFHSRPVSQVYNPPTMASGKEDQIDELRPVFSFLSSHQNKLYQEGYFLKLHDLDTNGKPNSDRSWTECFAQLVGTVLSLWDAAALDAAGQDGEVAPSFINLADASIKMIETLPTRNNSLQPLQNVLSVSSAGKNRYLFHFNSLHSLTQWTAGIRLAMFEHASLQELYTGSLIAGKGKFLNNIKAIMDRLRFVEEDWARVRFGAGTPWRRCWYVIQPPDEKEWQKANKTMRKRGTYERPQYPRGDIKFYDTKKTKKAKPIATISNVYSAYAVYPQAKPLIDQSTLVKLEGTITIHSQPESQTEGFVFVMPELHPAVTGFEMLLRFLFPIFDTFSLYGRPNRLIADTLDSRGLMFAMPKDRRYGYLDIIDVAGLIHTEGSDRWAEREWSKRMKELVSRRMTMATQGRTSNVESGGRRSLGGRPGVQYAENGPIRSTDAFATQSTDMVYNTGMYNTGRQPHRNPAAANSIPGHIHQHTRSSSESNPLRAPPQQRKYIPTRLSTDQEARYPVESPETSPFPHSPVRQPVHRNGVSSEEVMTSSNSSASELGQRIGAEQVTHDLLPEPTPPAPVNQPYFQHLPSDRPQRFPVDRPEMRREKSRMSNATLDQLVDATRNGSDAGAAAAATAAWRTNGRYDGQDRGSQSRVVHPPPLPSNLHTIPPKTLPSHTPPPNTIDNPPSTMHDRDSSPDYASSSQSHEKQPPARRLGGVRKTVGDPNYVSQHRNSDIPDFDFGITQSLTPVSSRPGTAAGRVSPNERYSPTAPQTPTEIRKSYADRISPGRASPARTSPLPSPLSRSSSRQKWYPGMSTGRQSPGGLTAEEFVQQRAAIARVPSGYVSRRTLSNNRCSEDMLTPPPEQVPAQAAVPSNHLHKRSHSRPSSRGSLLDFSSTLSAREQEHVARMTGSSLLRLPERSQTPDPNVGLIGAISAREQDRRNMMEGLSSQRVDATIAQRQQQNAQAAYASQMQAQYRTSGSAWGPQQQQFQPQNYYVLGGYFAQPPYYQPPQSYYPTQQQKTHGQNQQFNQYYGAHYPSRGGYQRQ